MRRLSWPARSRPPAATAATRPPGPQQQQQQQQPNLYQLCSISSAFTH